MNKKILIPIPDKDFDPTEVSIPWSILVQDGFEITFATENGTIGQTDPLMLTGVIFGKLKAKPDAIEAYNQMKQTKPFLYPIKYDDIHTDDYDALLLPGGHAKGMKQYLESEVLQAKVLEFMKQNKIIAAICHGTVVLARTIDPETGRSILFGRKVTSLPKYLERTAYTITCWKHGDYYRTYPEYVQDEVEGYLKTKSDFQVGGVPWKPFCCVDGNLITSRYPKDAKLFGEMLAGRLKGNVNTSM